eukprot:12924412-Prorocentrum_lima.AAC.1
MDKRFVGMTSWSGDARKPTGWMANCSLIAKSVSRRCPGGQAHIQLIGGLAKGCETFPPALV